MGRIFYVRKNVKGCLAQKICRTFFVNKCGLKYCSKKGFFKIFSRDLVVSYFLEFLDILTFISATWNTSAVNLYGVMNVLI